MVPTLAIAETSVPKSDALPCVLMVMNSSTLVRPSGVLDPTMTVLVCESQQFVLLFSCVRQGNRESQ